MSYSFQLRQFDDEIRRAYLDLLPNQSRAVTAGKLDWKFGNNPHGLGKICVARDESGKIVGLNAFMACKMGGSVEPALVGRQSMDTIVAPEARGKGLFTRMLEAFYQKSDDSFVYGFPNGNSAPGFFGKLGWTHLGFAPIMVRPLRAKYFASKLKLNIPDFSLLVPKKAGIGEKTERFGSWADEISYGFLSNKPSAITRDHSYLNWRFVDNPAYQYEILRSENSFIVRSLQEKHEGKIGYVLECMGEQREMVSLLKETVAEMSDRGADALLSWCLPHSPNYRAYRRAGFFPLPPKLRPIEIHWGVRPLDDRGRLSQQENWYISYCDSDTV